MDIEIIHCMEADLDDLIVLEISNMRSPYSAEILSGMLKNPRIILLKAVTGGKIAGYAGAEVVIDEAEVANIVVAKDFRRHGIGQKLVEKLLETLANYGIKRTLLEVNVHNNSAISLYIKCGFRQISIRPRYYGEDAALIMEYSFGK